MKNFLFLSLCLLFPLSLLASTIDDFFVKIPDEYYMFQPKESRVELVKEYKNNDNSGVSNRFGGETYLLDMDTINNFLRLRNTQISTLEMKLWQTKDGKQLVGLNITTCVPLCDSNIGFFTEDWQYVKESILPHIGIIDFLDTQRIVADGRKTEDIIAAFDIVFFQYIFPKQGTEIVVELLFDKKIDDESVHSLLSYLKGTKLSFVWKNDVFEKGEILR